VTNEEAAREQIRQAARFLVRNPLLATNGKHSRTAALIHDNGKFLKGWFDEYLGWPLVLERDVIRLVKVPAGPPAHEDDAPGRRCCVLFCLLLAALEDTGNQTVISELAETVTTIAAATTGITAYDAEYSDRKALVQAIRLLVDTGALIPVRDIASTREDENKYVEEDGNALYDVDHRAAALLMACPTPPTRAGIPTGITRQSYPDTAEGANRRRRHDIMRRLVDTPAMYFDELPHDVQDYFRHQRTMFVRQLRDVLDVRLEIRAEGAAVVDDELTDVVFPKDTKDPYIALLFADSLVREPDAMDPSTVVWNTTLSRLADEITRDLVARNVRVTSAKEVLQTSLSVLSKLRLVELIRDEGIRLLPALGRYRNVQEPPPQQQEPDAALFPIPEDQTTPSDEDRR
jgi:uncharacterized protein (TIGR02678 family)